MTSSSDLRHWMRLCEASDWIRLYRGETASNRGGGYYSPDREFARQFTRSGRDSEIIVRQIKASDVYVPPTPVRAAASTPALEQLWDDTCELARSQGFKAVQFDEGSGEPPSIYVLDKSALRR